MTTQPQTVTLAQALDVALNLQQGGDLRKAEEIYRQILQVDPNHADALQLLGTIAFQTRHFDAAIDLINRAIQAAPGHAPFWYNLGVIHKEMGVTDKAVECFRRALEIAPTHFDALTNLAGLHHATGSQAEAAAHYEAALQLKPDSPDTLNNFGILHYEQNRLDEAIACYERALALSPARADILNNLGLALMDKGQVQEAANHYRRALEFDPALAETYNNLGYALRVMGFPEQAIAHYRQAVALCPNHAEAWNNLGAALFALESLDDAIAAYHRALDIRPDFAMALNNLGLALQQRNELDEAIIVHQRALECHPGLAEAHSNLSLAYTRQGKRQQALVNCYQALAIARTPEILNNLGTLLKDEADYNQAEDCYRQALALKPDYVEAHFNLALIHLVRGDFPAGWEEYEWRYHPGRNVNDRVTPPALRQPMWQGEALAGQTLLIYPEQGFGDVIQFCRYAEKLKQAGATVWLAAPPELDALLRTLPWADRIISRNQEILEAEFDYWVFVMSLPKRFSTTLDDISASPPYLHADREKSAAWRERLDAWAGARRKIGLVWAGRPTHNKDLNRSMLLADFAPLAALSDACFISLQKGERSTETAPPGMDLLRLGDELKDFSDTAALLDALDLLICVDTSVAHLAGALGKPAWTLLPYVPDWRWLLERGDSPWYPTLRLFRQPAIGDWASVIGRVAGAIKCSISVRVE